VCVHTLSDVLPEVFKRRAAWLAFSLSFRFTWKSTTTDTLGIGNASRSCRRCSRFASACRHFSSRQGNDSNIWHPSEDEQMEDRITSLALTLGNACSACCVSICTFVPVKQVNWEPSPSCLQPYPEAPAHTLSKNLSPRVSTQSRWRPVWRWHSRRSWVKNRRWVAPQCYTRTPCSTCTGFWRLRCQYLYFRTGNASKLSTWLLALLFGGLVVRPESQMSVFVRVY
jgi:hypothetical protein